MTRSVGTALVLLLLVVGIPACGAVSFGFCTGWFCWDWNPYPPPCYPGWCYSSAALAVTDVDDDGHDDIVTGGPDTSTLTVLLGSGAGTWSPGRGYDGSRDDGVDRLVMGRFDDDAYDDVATYDARDDVVRIFRGDGRGGFELAATRALSSTDHVRSLLKADLDGEGREELLVVEGSGRATRVAALDAGTALTRPLARRTVGDAVTVAKIADLDGDGAGDLIVADEFAETVEVWLGTMGGGFDAPLWSGPTGGRPIALVVTRLNDDAALDLAVLDGLDGSLRVYLGAGDGTFAASDQGTIAGRAGAGLALVALPGVRGGKASSDLVVLTAGLGTAEALAFGLESDAEGRLRLTGKPAPLPPVKHLVPGDFNQDGIPDLAFPGGPRSAVGVAFGGARQP